MLSLSALIRFIHLTSSLFLLGSFMFHAAVWRPALRKAGAENSQESAVFECSQLRLARWTLLAVFVSGLLAFGLQVVAVTGASFGQALSPETVGGVLFGTRYGNVWLFRIGLILVLGGILWLGLDRRSFSLQVTALLLAAPLVIALAFAGHAAAGEGSFVIAQLAADALHLLAASAWLGGLAAFALFLVWLARTATPWSETTLQEATWRFSLLGLTSVILLVLTGLINAWTLVGAVPPLMGTTYGNLLIIKLILLLPLIGVAAINRLQIKPQILALRIESSIDAMKALLLRLKRNVVTEAVLGVAILLIVGLMSVTPPARHIQPHWPFSFRWNWNAAQGSAKVRSQLTVGRWMGAAGVAGLAFALLRRRHRHLALGASVASLAYGGLVSHYGLSIDAYPTTYTRPSVPYNAISVANGAFLYQEACAVCHGKGGYGDGPGGKGLKPRPADLTAKHAADHTAGDLFWWLTHGVKGTAMPGFNASLEEEERWDMINFLRALSYAERARQMTGLVEPDPWLVAPDFVYRTSAEEGKSLKDHRDNRIVLLVLFTLPSSAARLAELDQAYGQLKKNNVEVIVIPNEVEANHKLDGAIQSLALVTDGSREIFDTYTLFRRSFSEQGSQPDPPIPPHTEFLIDRQGYVRARWIARDGPGWDKMDSLMREIDRLNKEKPSAPAPDEHVH